MGMEKLSFHFDKMLNINAPKVEQSGFTGKQETTPFKNDWSMMFYDFIEQFRLTRLILNLKRAKIQIFIIYF